MGYVLEPVHAAATLVGVLTMGVGLAVYRLEPGRQVNRRLAYFLGAEGLGTAAGWGMANMATTAHAAGTWEVISWIAYATLVPIYLLFLGTLRTPLTRPFRSRAGTLILGGLVAAAALTASWMPHLFFQGPLPVEGSATWATPATALGSVLPMVHGVLALLGLIAAWDQWRRASDNRVARRQAGAYLLAFGWRDVTWAFFLLVGYTWLFPATEAVAPWLPTGSLVVVELVFVALVTYGVLSAQLLGIDVALRAGVRRSLVVGAIAAAFFTVSEATEALVSGRAGTVAGLLAAALMALAATRLDRWAERIARHVIPADPNPGPGDEKRRREMYQAALEAAMQDGEIGQAERGMLDRLRDRLGLPHEVAAELERQAT